MKQGIKKLLCNIKSLPAEIVGENKSFLITGRLPRLRLAMTALRGFTLIELLVVVLIIGILAAVALPQYQKAVSRTRLGSLKPLLSSVAEAQKRYYLANNETARSFADLDISLPGNCEISQSEWYGESARCGKFTIWLDSAISHVVQGILYLPDSSRIRWVMPNGFSSQHTSCWAEPGGEENQAKKLCLAEGGRYVYTAESGDQYEIQ